MIRDLPPDVVVLPGTDVADLWDRFEVFEALHHGMAICNPMSAAEIDRVIALLDPAPGDRMIDIACGHGELLIRTAARVPITGVGIDLSPWAVVRARHRASALVPDAALEWWLGDGKALPVEAWDVVTCLGAPWIWNGFRGTARALAARCRPGSAMAIGDLALKDGLDPGSLSDGHGAVLTADDQAAALESVGFESLERLVVSADGLAAYDARTAASAEAWSKTHPGAGDEHLRIQREWADDHRHDREILDWVVWVGRRAGAA